MADSPPTKWLMPDSTAIDPIGELRFFLQPRWSPGSFQTEREVFRRREYPTFTELEFEVPFPEGSAIAVGALMPYYGDGAMTTVCYGDFFQPIRRLLLGPADDAFRMRTWNRLAAARPIFAAAWSNGMYSRVDDAAFIHHPDPATDQKKNMLVSLDRSRSRSTIDDPLFVRFGSLMILGMQMYREASVPVELGPGGTQLGTGDFVETAGTAARWVFDNAGKIKDVVDLVRVFTG